MSRYTIYWATLIFGAASLLLASLALSLLPFSSVTRLHKSPLKATVEEFGIGFDLTPSYGTVAVAYLNGSIHSMAKIEGDAAYKEMMYRLSLPSSKTTHQPYRLIGDEFQDLPRHLWRQARKNLGLPASNDVGTLSKMIAALRAEASTFVRQPVTAASISIPYVAALYGEDAVDAFEYLSLEYIEYAYFKDFVPIESVSSVYLTYNRELYPCTSLANRSTCPTKEEKPPHIEKDFNALVISYTYSDLTVGIAYFSKCYLSTGFYYGKMWSGIADMELGFNARWDGDYGDGPYWEKVKYVIQQQLGGYAAELTRVIVWGDAAVEMEFGRRLKEALDEVVTCKHLQILTEDNVYSAAKGSAEFARRALKLQREQGDISEAQEEL